MLKQSDWRQALEALRKLKSEKTAEAREFKLRLEHLKTHKDTAGRLRADVEAGNRRVAETSEQGAQLQHRIQARLGYRVLGRNLIWSILLAIRLTAHSFTQRILSGTPLGSIQSQEQYSNPFSLEAA